MLTLAPTVAIATFAVADRSAESMVLAGALITLVPSLGHIYSGEAGKACGMVLLRMAGVGLAALMWVDMMRNHESPGQGTFSGGRAVVAVLAAAAVPVTLVYEAIDAPRAARRFNEKHGLNLTPMVVPGGPAPLAGLAVQGRF
jgi:hypothetical protein